jgi:hypothetical protein
MLPHSEHHSDLGDISGSKNKLSKYFRANASSQASSFGILAFWQTAPCSDSHGQSHPDLDV